MKILVVDNMLVPFDPHSVPGGTERRNISDAVAFAALGHEVTLTIVGEDKELRVHQGVKLIRLHSQGKETVEDSREWQRTVTRRMVSFLNRSLPDVVHYGCNSHFWLAKMMMKEFDLPLNIQVGNYLSGNALYDEGRLKDLFLLKSLGAHFVFNTQTCANIFQSQIDQLNAKGKLSRIPPKQIVPICNKVNRNNAGVGFVGNPSDGPVREDGGYAVIAARADPAKRVGSFATVKFPLKVFLKYRSSTDKDGFFEKLVSRLRKNPNIEVHIDQPYSKIMLSMSKARAVLVSWPDETFGLTAFEAATFGVPAIVFRRSPQDLNATEEFLRDILNTVGFSYSDKDWKKGLQSWMEKPQSLAKRERYASRCRERYSYEDYVKERISSLKAAIRLRKNKS